MFTSLIGAANNALMRVQNTSANGSTTITVDPNEAYVTNFDTLLTLIMNVVLTIGTVAVLFYLIWGGLDWITSGGDKGKTESARNKITAAIIGLIILISSWAILTFVQSLLNINVFQ
jgi:hypothetical protein